MSLMSKNLMKLGGEVGKQIKSVQAVVAGKGNDKNQLEREKKREKNRNNSNQHLLSQRM